MATSRRRFGLASIAVAAAALIVAPVAAQVERAERIGITEVAPRDSFFILSIPDYPAAKAALDRSGLGRLWAEPQVRGFLISMFKEELSDEDGRGGPWGWFAENIDPEDLREPTGAAGLALFPAKVPNPGDNNEQVDRVQGILIAEFGEDAGAVFETIQDALERLEAAGHLTLDDDEHDEVPITIVKIIEPDADALRGDDEFAPESDRSLDAFRTLMIAHAEGCVVVSTNRPALEQAIDRLAGGRADAIGELPVYRTAAAQHPAGQHALIIAIASPYVRATLQEGFETPMSMLPVPLSPEAVVGALGIGAIEAAGIGVRFDTDAGVMEQSFAVLAPEKRGLLNLLDDGLVTFDPPAFVPADAMGVWSLALRFDRVTELLRALIRALPPEMQQQILAGFDQAVAPILGSLGSQMHVVRTLDRPLGPDSASAFVAIRLVDPLALANSLNGFAPMLQFTPRDFEGNQIFEGQNPGQPSIAIGFDHVFIGPTEAIENALRLASRPETPRLAGAERFTRAVRPLAGNAAFYYYDNFDESLAWEYWSTQNAEKAFAAQLQQWGVDAETMEEFLADFRESQPKWRKNLPPMEILLEHLGDSVMEIRPTPDGFRGRAIILRPE